MKIVLEKESKRDFAIDEKFNDDITELLVYL